MKKSIYLVIPIVIALLIAALFIPFPSAGKKDIDIVLEYVNNQDKNYSDDEKVEIVKAYKRILQDEGETYADTLISKEDQLQITYLGMSVNEYVFRDFNNSAFLNADDSFMDVKDYSKIAGFDVDGSVGADGYIDLRNVDIVIDDVTYATADLQDEVDSFFDRFIVARQADSTINTIYSVDVVDIDSDTRLYITYMDISYDDSYNVLALRVSGHLVMR